MNKISNRIKSFFIEKESEKITDKKEVGLYVVKLQEDFRNQFPITLKNYIQVDTQNPNNYTLTDKIYQGLSFGHKVLLTLKEAENITEELYAVPLEVILVDEERSVDDNV